jgi:hypothetical protein
MVSPRMQFESVLGPCSLNLFVAVADRSGGGKSTGYKVGKELTPVPPSLSMGDRYRDGMGLGSGEGLAEIYMGMETVSTGDEYQSGPRKGQPKTKEVRAKVRDNAFLYVDEGQALMEQGKRQGNTIFPTLRSAWDGATLGQANARMDTTRHIPEGSYSMGLAIGFQEDTCQDLLADSTAGTPQRLVWCWATDPEIPDERPEWPGDLSIDLHSGYLGIQDDGDGFATLGGRRIRFTQEINDELWREDLAKNRGEIEVPRLDSQKPKMLCKLSTLLCLIDGRSVVTPEDWDLAKTMYDTSSAVVGYLIECGQEMAESRAEASADRHAVREAKGHYAKTTVNDNIHRIAVLTYRHAVDGGVMTPGAHRRLHASRDKPFFSEALDYAIKQKWLSVDGGKVATHIETPPE